MKVFLMLSLLLSFTVKANECAELSKCVEYISKLTGKKYLYDAKAVKGGLQASSNTEINAENADTLFTYILDLNGYARIPTAVKDTYLIIDSRDMRYQALPTIEVNSQTPPKLTANYDFYMMNFKFKNYDQGQIRMAANSLRPFMSRYARVIEAGNMMTIQENAAKLEKFYDMIKSFDRELTKSEVKNLKDIDIDRKEMKMHEVKKVDKKEDKK